LLLLPPHAAIAKITTTEIRFIENASRLVPV
jgi:hypothetical protein